MHKTSTLLASAIAALITAGICYAGSVVDQGAPGRSGPWPVYCLTSATQLLSKANASFSLTPGMIAGHAVYTSTQTLAGVVAGNACAVGVPGTFDTVNLIATCVTGTGNVTFNIYNTTGVSVLGTSGSYTAVVF